MPGIEATSMLLVLEAYMGTRVEARASWWHSSVIMGSATFCSAAVCLAASALVLSRHCRISATVSLKAKASFANLDSYPTLVRAMQFNGVYWSIGASLIGDSIATGSPFSSRGRPSSPHTMKSAFFQMGPQHRAGLLSKSGPNLQGGFRCTPMPLLL